MGKSKEICSCKHVTKDEIREAVREGVETYKDVKRATGAGSKCGKCHRKVEKIIEEELAKLQEEAQAETAAAPEAGTQPTSEPTEAAPSPESSPAVEAPSFPEELSGRAVPAAQQEIKAGGIYRHFKGDYYLVKAIATGSEDGKKQVVYRKLYGDGSLWVRPLDMFASPVDRTRYPDATQDLRFCLMDVTSVRSR